MNTLSNNETKHNKNLLEVMDDTIRCEDCAFNDDCEERFDGCVANYAKDDRYLPDEVCHLKNCELIHWNELDKDAQNEFMYLLTHNSSKEN